MKRATILLLFLFGLSACGSIQMSSMENYSKRLEVYVGKDIANVINAYGHADNLSQAPNGNRLFVYTHYRTFTTPVNCQINDQGDERCTGGNINELWCKTYFEVDSTNVVKAYSFKGNNCVACESDDALMCI